MMSQKVKKRNIKNQNQKIKKTINKFKTNSNSISQMISLIKRKKRKKKSKNHQANRKNIKNNQKLLNN